MALTLRNGRLPRREPKSRRGPRRRLAYWKQTSSLKSRRGKPRSRRGPRRRLAYWKQTSSLKSWRGEPRSRRGPRRHLGYWKQKSSLRSRNGMGCCPWLRRLCVERARNGGIRMYRGLHRARRASSLFLARRSPRWRRGPRRLGRRRHLVYWMPKRPWRSRRGKSRCLYRGLHRAERASR